VTPGAVGLIIESLGSLSLQEDRLVALAEAGQVNKVVSSRQKMALCIAFL
jgi:hypothetical protein